MFNCTSACFILSGLFFAQMHCVNCYTCTYEITCFVGPGTPYQVRVVAVSSVGVGALGDPVIFFSEELAPIKPPESIKVDYISATSINVSWTPLSLFEARGFPNYKVTLLSASKGKRFTMTNTNNFAVFNYLDNNDKYSVKVAVTTGERNTFISSGFIKGM